MFLGRESEPPKDNAMARTLPLPILGALDDAAENGLDGAPYGVEELAAAAAGEIRHMREQIEAIIAGRIDAAAVKAEWIARDEADALATP
jgi:hypothetical protein